MPNNMAVFHQAVYLTGPTGVGKSEISLRLAERLNAEIIALDAMTVYRGMDIGTAKPSSEEMSQIKHHMVDVIDPSETFDLDHYLRLVGIVLNNLASSGKTALFVGGSPLYLKACLRGLSDLPHRDESVRLALTERAQQEGVEVLHAQLAAIDPSTAELIAKTDLRRIVRAFEIYEVSGERPSQLRNKHDQPAPENVPVFALIRNRTTLYERINSRVDRMFDMGLINEAASLPQPLSRTASQAVGYSEAFEFLEGKCSEAEAREKVKLRTRHYAKHQLTWFRRLEEVKGVEIDTLTVEESVKNLLTQIKMIKSGQPVVSAPIPRVSGKRPK